MAKLPSYPKSNLEPVDGARVAARILNRMSESNKRRIVDAIQAKNPTIAAKIQEKIFTFDDVAQLNRKSIQILINEIEHEDLVVSLKLASDELKEVLLSNMSERKRSLVEDDFAALPPMKLSEVEDAKKRILSKADELRTSGRIQCGTGDKSEVYV